MGKTVWEEHNEEPGKEESTESTEGMVRVTQKIGTGKLNRRAHNRAEQLGSLGSHGQDYQAEAPGSSGRHDQTL